jgi:hypothetical protein
MNRFELLKEIVATYERHGWKLKRVLLQSSTRAALSGQADQLFKDATVQDAEFDALWFARPSHGNREAWELRPINEQRYALFEAFEADESEEKREEVRREMENQIKEYVT